MDDTENKRAFLSMFGAGGKKKKEEEEEVEEEEVVCLESEEEEEEEVVVVVDEKNEKEAQWTCAACTYVQTSSAEACAMCHTPRTGANGGGGKKKEEASKKEEKASPGDGSDSAKRQKTLFSFYPKDKR